MRGRPYRSYTLLTLLFNAILAGFVGLSKKEDTRKALPMSDFLLLSLATYRLGRLIAYDKVTSWLRRPFVRVGEGPAQPEDVKEAPSGEGVRLALAQLITCSWCNATWVAPFLYFGLLWRPSVARPFVTVIALSGAEQLLDAAFGLVHWTTARVRSPGAANL